MCIRDRPVAWQTRALAQQDVSAQMLQMKAAPRQDPCGPDGTAREVSDETSCWFLTCCPRERVEV
eukprot:11778008-Alexandrium_andersonii.AAC.1